MNDVILYFSLKYNGDFYEIFKALKTKEAFNEEEFKTLKSNLTCHYVTILDPDYPDRLKNISNPPFVLYYYGNLDYLKNLTLGVVGMREPTDYGKEVTKQFVESLSKDFVIVSGMAKGIDGISHLSAINSGNKTVAILGSGIDDIYPKQNTNLYHILKKEHLIISEYPFKQGFKPVNFINRNRIVAGLSDKLLVTQANIKSGTMTTVNYCLEQGKDVYAIPARIDDPSGTLFLIDQGAKLVMTCEDIKNDYFF